MPSRVIAPLLKLFGTNWITLFGASLTTASALGIVGFMLLGLLGLADSPYIALMALLVLPGVFVTGLLAIPIGLFWQKRKDRLHPEDADQSSRRFPVIDLNRDRVRRLMAGVGVLTMVNVLLIAIVSYEGVVYMETTEFCGEVCHTVMEPEFTSYKGSPHSRVKCVECHIGPGAPWFVRSKLSGVGQVFAVTFDTYQRPIPTPVENLRPSQDTCEQCHWPSRFTGDTIKVIRRYSPDEVNTPLTTVLLMHIGGGHREEGIHSWHIDPDKQTTYIAEDRQRQEISWIEVREGDQITEYTVDGMEIDEKHIATSEKRIMDCIDCHNRPTHVYDLPGPALDEALEEKRISASIPFIKKIGVQVLTEVAQEEAGVQEVPRRLRTYYEEQHGEFYSTNRSLVDQAIEEIEGIYASNVFPAMKLTWKTYPNNIGHQEFPGCFRCHDGEHVSSDGKSVVQDCSICHTILAWDEESPEILQQLGLE